MTLALASYATGKFLPLQKELHESASRQGITQHFAYNRDDLTQTAYYKANRSILDEPCGAGFWAWKPFFILETLAQLKEDDVLFYCDAGSLFLQDPTPLTEICQRHPQGLVLFDARPLTNRAFTKRDCFVRLGCDAPEFWDSTKVIATLLVVRKGAASLAFLAEWLHHCQDRAAITDDPSTSGLRELKGYRQHRWDQSILSVLAAKHQLETFRSPTKWGNFLKLPAFREAGEEIVSPYDLPPKITAYADQPQANSPYGTIFLINRLPNFDHKKPYQPEPLRMRIKARLRPLVQRLRGLLRSS